MPTPAVDTEPPWRVHLRQALAKRHRKWGQCYEPIPARSTEEYAWRERHGDPWVSWRITPVPELDI